jgi:hypothetical protein
MRKSGCPPKNVLVFHQCCTLLCKNVVMTTFFFSFLQLLKHPEVQFEDQCDLSNNSNAPIHCTVQVTYFSLERPHEFIKLRSTDARLAKDYCLRSLRSSALWRQFRRVLLQHKGILIFSKVSKPTGFFHLGVEQQRLQNEHWPSFEVETEKKWSYTSTPLPPSPPLYSLV